MIDLYKVDLHSSEDRQAVSLHSSKVTRRRKETKIMDVGLEIDLIRTRMAHRELAQQRDARELAELLAAADQPQAGTGEQQASECHRLETEPLPSL